MMDVPADELSRRQAQSAADKAASRSRYTSIDVRSTPGMQEIIDLLRRRSALTTLAIAKAVHGEDATKAMVNPTLYALAAKDCVQLVESDDGPVKWRYNSTEDDRILLAVMCIDRGYNCLEIVGLCSLPLDVVRVGMERLLLDGCVSCRRVPDTPSGEELFYFLAPPSRPTP